MLDSFAAKLGLPVAAVVALGLLVVVQIGLQVWALVDLARRPRVVRFSKWVWALIIVLGELVGAIAYLVLGRRAVAESPDGGGADLERARRAADALYGRKDGR